MHSGASTPSRHSAAVASVIALVNECAKGALGQLAALRGSARVVGHGLARVLGHAQAEAVELAQDLLAVAVNHLGRTPCQQERLGVVARDALAEHEGIGQRALCSREALLSSLAPEPSSLCFVSRNSVALAEAHPAVVLSQTKPLLRCEQLQSIGLRLVDRQTTLAAIVHEA